MFYINHRQSWYLLFLLLGSFTAISASLQPPSGRVILTATGLIANHNAAEVALLDMALLDQLPQVTVNTTTPWYDESKSFSGPLVRDLLKLLDAQGDMVKATALNDYSTTIPLQDFEHYDVILATRLDGNTMSIREKGPIFVIYPFDDKPELVNETYYQRCVWQLNRLDFQ